MHKEKREKRQRNDPGRSESLFSLLSFEYLFFFSFFFTGNNVRFLLTLETWKLI